MSTEHCRVVVARSWKQAQAHRHSWAELHARRLEDNLFLRPDFLLPLIEHASAEHPFALTFVYDARDRLVAVAAFDDTGGADVPLAGRTISSWEHPLLFDSTPLLDRRHAEVAATALWEWMTDTERPWSFVRWARVRLDSASWQQLAAVIDASEARWWARHLHRRPALAPIPGRDDWLAGMSRSRRKRIRRIERGLRAAGEVRVRVTRDHDPGVVDRFLALERAGWKGDNGTALACDPGQERFFRAAAAALGESDENFFVELLLDGRPIAITANFVDGGRLYAYKTAYDPEHGELSPGIAIEDELVLALERHGRIRMIDSCAGADSHLAGLWGDRVTIGEIVCSTGAFSALSISAVPHVRRSRRLARDLWQGLRKAAG